MVLWLLYRTDEHLTSGSKQLIGAFRTILQCELAMIRNKATREQISQTLYSGKNLSQLNGVGYEFIKEAVEVGDIRVLER